MINIQATYFDGISSVPNTINISFCDTDGTISLSKAVGGVSLLKAEEFFFERYGNCLYLKINKKDESSIKITDSDFIELFIRYRKKKGKIGVYDFLVNQSFKTYVIIAIIVLGFVTLSYFIILPAVAERAAVLIPKDVDVYLGETFFEGYIKLVEIDSEKSQLMNEFAQELDLKNKSTIKFTVVNSPEINAFALPDGNIVIFTGILNQIKSSHELSALICHEVVHINNRHSIKMLCRNLSGYLFVSAVFSDVNGIVAVIAENAHNLQSLSYSRQFEEEADREGANLLIHNNLNPNGMIDLFSRLEKETNLIMPEFLSSHPLTTERLDYINKHIKESSFKVTENQRLDNLFSKIVK